MTCRRASDLEDFSARRVAEFQRVARDREFPVHRRDVLAGISNHAAVFKRQAVGILEVARLSPSVIDDFGGLYALGAQLVALLCQRGRRAGFERKMIEGSGKTEPAVDARIVFCRHSWNPTRFQKGDTLTAPDIEKDVSEVPAFFDVYRVVDDRLESQNALVKLTGLVQVKRREADVRKTSVSHGCRSLG
jgi:hypothetical protein